jgi:hypothetical protein
MQIDQIDAEVLTKEKRDALGADDFAVPGKRALPIHDARHIKMSWGMIEQRRGLTAVERAEGRRRILAHAHKCDIDTSEWEAQQVPALSINARSLDIPNEPHVNKMPFSGVLTRIGEPSDEAPEGSGGRRVTITKEAAERALDSLLGMAVDYQAGFAGHDPQAKIGVITGATIDGNSIRIKGFIYAADFPDLAAEIKKNKDALGFSFEARDLLTDDPDGDPVPIIDCVFTGAAILLKDKAAYHSTSIAAKANGDFKMDKDVIERFDALGKQIEAAVGAIAPVAKSVGEIQVAFAELQKAPEKIAAANLIGKVEPHAVAVEKEADKMDDAGIGGHPSRGHAAVLRNMAGCMRADAVQGKMPHIFDGGSMYSSADTRAGNEAAVKVETDKVTATLTKKLDDTVTELKAAAVKTEKVLKDELESAKTTIADLTAKAATAAAAPDRKTVKSGEAAALLAKHHVDVPEKGGKLAPDKLTAILANCDPGRRIEIKTILAHAGLID